MKNPFTVIFLLFSLISYSQEINQKDKNGGKQGVWQKEYQNGVIRYTGRFKDNKPIGLFKHYYRSGKLNVKMHHFSDASYANIYYETGELKATGKYENQEKDSIWMYYHENGKIMSEEFYLSGKKEGVLKVYYDNGKLAEEKEYSQGVEDGEWKQYYQNQRLKMKAFYEKGSVEGKQYYYNTNGKVTLIGNIYHGARHGFWIFYNPDGTIKKKEEYKNGERIDENKDDDIINEDGLIKEKKDVLEFEDLLPPR